MRLATPPPRRESEHVIALINVVFLLLMFFLMTSTLMPPFGLELDPAVSSSATEHRTSSPVLAIDKNGALAIDGTPVAADGLDERLARDVAQYARAPLVIVADKALDASVLMAVVSRAAGAGFKSISLMTRRGAGK